MTRLNRFTASTLVAILLSLGLTPGSIAQNIIEFQYRHVAAEDIEEFVHLETTYWAEVAKKAIDDGRLTHWALWRTTSGWDLDEGTNFLFVNVYPDKEHLNGRGSIWNPQAVFPDVRVENIDTSRLSTVKHNVFLQAEAYVEKAPAQFVRINYAKASDINEYVELEKSIWQPFITGLMDNGKTDVTSWGVASLLVPNGASIPFNAITVDGFQNFSGTVQATWDSDVEIPDLSPLNEVASGFDRVSTYAVVKAVSAEM